jgi:VIT1/CCC1 family predicted Fe2+/Mn2+ transporter
MNIFNDKYLQDFSYGAIDGIITNFVVIAGVAGANLSNNTVIILGLANTFADGFSMATSRFLSNNKHEWKNALITFISFIALGIIPILPFFVKIKNKNKNKNKNKKFIISYILTFIMLFIVGIIKGYVLKSSILYYGLETVFIGGFASIISYYIAKMATKI